MDDVLLAVPTRGQVQWQTVQRLCELRDRHGLPPILWQPGNLSVAQTRNRIAAAFLRSEARTLVMVDDDVVPPPQTLEWLLPVPSGFGAVAVPHAMPHPADPRRLILTAFMQAGQDILRPAELRDGLTRVDAVATGCVAVTREALEALGPVPFRIPDDPAALPASDDFLFCADLKAAGYEVGAYVRDGWFCDHVTAVNLAPLLEAQRR